MDRAESRKQAAGGRFSPARREFGKRALGATLGGAAFFARLGDTAAAVHANAPGIKIAVQSPALPTHDDLLFLQQVGASYVSVGAPPELRTAEGFVEIRSVTRRRASASGTSAI